jgi:hypothetical protein
MPKSPEWIEAAQFNIKGLIQKTSLKRNSHLPNLEPNKSKSSEQDFIQNSQWLRIETN